MVFTVLGAVLELGRSLIVERVKARLRNALARGKTLGRPQIVLDTHKIAMLRVQGALGGRLRSSLALELERYIALLRAFQKTTTRQAFRESLFPVS